MDTKQLTTFVTFVKEGSYNRAAQKLNYGVSTLVAHIAALEEELKVELIHSQGRKSYLTVAGNTFLPYAQKMLENYNEARAAMSALDKIAGSLHLSVSETVGLHQLYAVYADFAKCYPQVELTVHVSSPQHFVNQLRNGVTDVVFTQEFAPIQEKDIISVQLFTEPVVLVAPEQHPLSKNKTVSPFDLKRQRMIFPRKEYIEHPTLKRVFSENQPSVNENLFLDSGTLLIKMIKEQKYLSFMPLSSVKSELSSGKLIELPWIGEPISMAVYALYERHSHRLPLIEALISVIQTADKIEFQ